MAQADDRRGIRKNSKLETVIIVNGKELESSLI